jgi:GTP-binding protein
MEDQKLTPVIALVGRTNVGKSTLFNRLIETRKAITSSFEGTTQDINFGHCHWRDQILTVIDTAGLDLTSKASTEAKLLKQAEIGMEKADVILMMVDVRSGMLPPDIALAKKLRKSKKTVLLVTNKADNPGLRRKSSGEGWAKLALGEPIPVSAANGSGVGDLLDIVLEIMKEKGLTTQPLPEPEVRVAIIGRPNVGKSSMLNALAGEDRVIVSEVPHTTKEPQDTMLTYTDEDEETHHILLTDTVGIRKKAKVGRGIERLGVSLSIDQLARADVALLMVDATEGVSIQERKLAGLIEHKNCGVLIVINKWDLADERELGSAESYAKEIMKDLPFLPFASVVFTSAKTGNRVGKLLRHVLEIAEHRKREIPQEELDRFVVLLKKKHGHIVGDKKDSNRPKVYGIRQVGVKPPTFSVVGKKKETLHPNFMKFIENRLRDEFKFPGNRIVVISREIRAKQR